MIVALTGSTGFIGSHVLAELLDNGHEVIALVRDEGQAEAVAAKGAKAEVVDLYNRPAVTEALRRSEGAVHTATQAPQAWLIGRFRDSTSP